MGQTTWNKQRIGSQGYGLYPTISRYESRRSYVKGFVLWDFESGALPPSPPQFIRHGGIAPDILEPMEAGGEALRPPPDGYLSPPHPAIPRQVALQRCPLRFAGQLVGYDKLRFPSSHRFECWVRGNRLALVPVAPDGSDYVAFQCPKSFTQRLAFSLSSF